MTATKTIHHADVVGSMLRPQELLDARTEMRAGKLAPEKFRAIEDAAIDDAIKLQEDAGLGVVTDGELRRDSFYSFFISGIDGVSPLPGNMLHFHGNEDDPTGRHEFQVPFSITGKVSPKSCPAVDEFEYASSKTDREVKVTLPSPLLMMLNFWNQHSKDAYPDPFDVATDARDAVAQWMRELADAGCTYIQIDTPELAVAYADAGERAKFASEGFDPDRLISYGTELIGSLGDIDLPGVTKAMHVCKGNGTQSYMGSGGYEAFSEKVFKEAGGFDVYHLEYDDERSGDFDPLAKLPDDKVAVLGLVSTKWVELEDSEMLKRRIDDAARFHPMENLALATQCGFASAALTAEQRKVTDQTQTDKLTLIVEVANDVWGTQGANA